MLHASQVPRCETGDSAAPGSISVIWRCPTAECSADVHTDQSCHWTHQWSDGGANVDLQSRKGATPLHLRAQRGRRLIVPLLEASADPTLPTELANAPSIMLGNMDIRRTLEGAE